MYPTRNKEGEFENKLMSGKGPLKWFWDRSNTFKLEVWILKIDLRIIWASNLFILKFLENYAIRVFNQITW
jgi:hypothetical protein